MAASVIGAIVYVEAGSSAAGSVRPPTSPRRNPTLGRARGFVVDAQGYIVTSAKWVGDTVAFEVTLYDGRRLPAVLVAEDTLNDIALLRVNATGLPVIALDDSRGLATGERVLVIGDGPEAEGVFREATVRATGRATGANLAVDLGVSAPGAGAPLLNRLGRAVVMVTNSPGFAGEATPLTFAVPIDRVKPLLRQLKSARGPTSALAPGR